MSYDRRMLPGLKNLNLHDAQKNHWHPTPWHHVLHYWISLVNLLMDSMVS